jgi:hypothetical protein
LPTLHSFEDPAKRDELPARIAEAVRAASIAPEEVRVDPTIPHVYVWASTIRTTAGGISYRQSDWPFRVTFGTFIGQECKPVAGSLIPIGRVVF